VAGTLLVLQQDLGVRIDGGIDLVCSSAVPEALGVSSSAAIEVASLQALSQAFDYEIEGPRLAILCQKVENEIVGAPCGVMDQMTAACGEEGLFLQLLCQPAQLQPPLQLPQGLSLWGVDSGVRHAVSGSDYEGVRCGAYMGYRIIAELLSLPVTLGAPGQVQVEDEPFGGFLANVGAELWNRELRAKIPEELAGCDFLERYGGTTDPITRVDPQRLYAVRQPTQHPIEEHARVQRFAHLMKGAGAAAAEELGALMVESHRSYSACGLGNEATERLVELVLQQGPSRGLFGAKITGGGSGGTVAILARADRAAAVREVVETFAEERGQRPYLFQGSSPGACTWGVRRLQ
jgi:L-arabinokinase